MTPVPSPVIVSVNVSLSLSLFVALGFPSPAHAGPTPSPTTRPPIALRYGDPVPPTARPALALRVEEVVIRLARQAPPRSPAAPAVAADPRLALALDRLMSALPAAGPPPGGLTEHALWLTGIVEPVPYLLTMLVPAGADDDVEQQLLRVLPPVLAHGRYRRVAAAVQQLADGTARLALALQESFVELAPIPRALAAGARVVIAGRTLPPYGKPEVYVTAPDGKVSRLPLEGKGNGNALRAVFTCGAQPGAYQIEVAGQDPLGDMPLANFPLHCDVAAPVALVLPVPVVPALAVERGAKTDKLRAEVEGRVLELLQKNRATAGLPPLTSDARLAAVARGHSVDMRDHHFFGHISPTTGSAMDRLVRAAVVVVRVRENLGRAWSAAELDRGLMGSPSHRANMLADDVDRVGIGVAVGSLDGASGTYDLFLTQLFARVPEAWDPARADAALRARVAAIRREGSSPPLDSDAALDEVAREVAAQLAAGARGEAHRDGGDVVERALPSLSDRYQWVRQVSARAVDVSQLGASPALLDRAVTHAGIAVAAGPRDESGGTPLWLVILLAAKR